MRLIILMLIFIHLFAKNVLIINSYSIQLDWTKGELEGILKKLKKRSDVKSYVEFMDTKVFRPTPIRKYNFFEQIFFNSLGILFLTFIPIPTIVNNAFISPTISQRIPQTFFPSIRTSFGHFILAFNFN